MKMKTIYNYLRYTDNPYSEIIAKAKKSKDLKVNDKRNEGYLTIKARKEPSELFSLTFLKKKFRNNNINHDVVGFSRYF